MNTGFLRYTVATALTVYGIETNSCASTVLQNLNKLQQHLPFTVLKLVASHIQHFKDRAFVATALTVYGIETRGTLALPFNSNVKLQQHLPFTVLKQHHLGRTQI